MNNAKLQSQKDVLVKKQLMDESDNLLDYMQGSTLDKRLGIWGRWRSGWIYFTEQKIICFWGVMGYLEIPYNSISALSKSTQMFLPFGITITHTDKNGKMVEDRISVQKRNEKINLISEKSGVQVS